MKKLNESLSFKDLENLISSTFTIDVYKSKSFDDDDTITISFTAKGELPAEDLEKFIEKGYKVLDAEKEISNEGEDLFNVFVEINREPKTAVQIDEMLNDLLNLVEFDTWKFKYYRDEKAHTYSKELMIQMVPFSKEAYAEKTETEKAETVFEFIGKNMLDKMSLNENVVTFTKGHRQLSYQLVEGEIDYSKVDISPTALRECNELDRFLHRSILIHKADGHLVLTKNNRRLYLKSL